VSPNRYRNESLGFHFRSPPHQTRDVEGTRTLLVVFALFGLLATGCRSQPAERPPASVTATASVPSATMPSASVARPTDMRSPAPIQAPQPTGTAVAIPSGTPSCKASDLVISNLAGNGATGAIVEAFAITNRSAAACWVRGTPVARFSDARGVAILTSTDFHEHADPVLLPPGLAQPGVNDYVTSGHGIIELWFRNGCDAELHATFAITIPDTGDVVMWRDGPIPAGRCDSPGSPAILVAYPIVDGIY
jgi:uncharacterized protein DUF4232